MTTRWLQPQRHRKCTSSFKNFIFPVKKDELVLAQEESKWKTIDDFNKIKGKR